MNIIEQVKQMKLEEARAEARREGRIEVRKEKNLLFVTNMLTKTRFSVGRIAKLVGVSEAYVKRVKASLKN